MHNDVNLHGKKREENISSESSFAVQYRSSCSVLVNDPYHYLPLCNISFTNCSPQLTVQMQCLRNTGIGYKLYSYYSIMHY
jgi:hypothetical protein